MAHIRANPDSPAAKAYSARMRRTHSAYVSRKARGQVMGQPGTESDWAPSFAQLTTAERRIARMTEPGQPTLMDDPRMREKYPGLFRESPDAAAAAAEAAFFERLIQESQKPENKRPRIQHRMTPTAARGGTGGDDPDFYPSSSATPAGPPKKAQKTPRLPDETDEEYNLRRSRLSSQRYRAKKLATKVAGTQENEVPSIIAIRRADARIPPGSRGTIESRPDYAASPYAFPEEPSAARKTQQRQQRRRSEYIDSPEKIIRESQKYTGKRQHVYGRG